jgi:hypothetical protein
MKLPDRLSRSILTALLMTLLLATPSLAADPDTAIVDTLHQHLTAISKGDFAAFSADADTRMRNALNEKSFAEFSSYLAKKLNAGYDITYLGELNQLAAKTYMWKVTFTDGSSDMLAKLTIRDGKMAGFRLEY